MEWIATSYGVSVVAVLADRGRQAPYDGVKRVTVWLDSKAEAESFRTGGNFDRVKQQAIGARALAALPEGEPMPFVVTMSFAAEARREAHAHFTPQVCERLRAELAHPLVMAVRIWYDAVVFLETDAQVAQFAESAERERWTEIVWRAIHAGDEFGAVPRDGFQIRLDSEQNFQENYQGSSYYYWH